MVSSRNGHLEIVKYLLCNGVDVFAIVKFGYSALKLAKLRNHTEIVKILEDNITYRNSLILNTATITASKEVLTGTDNAPEVVLMDTMTTSEVNFIETNNSLEEVSEITEDEGYDFASVSDSLEAHIQDNAEYELETESDGWLL